MIINTSNLSESPKLFSGKESASILGLESDQMIHPKTPIRYDLQARYVKGKALIEGILEVELSCRCSRCAELFSKVIHIPSFSRSYQITTENHLIDLTGDIREDILLAFPMNIVCSSFCKGLCPYCGTNLNKQECSCNKEKRKSEWEILDQLKLST